MFCLKKICQITLLFSIFAVNNKTSFAELSYVFNNGAFFDGKFINGEDKVDKNENNDTTKDKNKNNDNNTDEAVNNGGYDKNKTGNVRNKLRLKINGIGEFQYFYNGQSSPYTQTILPNGMQTSPVILSHSSVYNGQTSVINMLGKIDINPEFVRYKPDDIQGEGVNPIALKVGLKISQPFMNATKNIDPKYAPQEYIYVDTDYFHFELGSVNSAASKMRVDAQKIASGNGGVFGTWWRYINLPVYNTNGLSTADANALNAMSPIYMLYPVLPNEAGFTAQRGIIGQPITTAMFSGIPNNPNLSYGSTAQPYPTHGAYSNKISIYSKRIKGVKIGFSYSPNTAQSGYLTKEINGNTSFYNNTIGGYVKNYIAVAIDYRKQWDKYGIGIAVSATYEHGNVMPANFLFNNNNTGRTETIKVGNSIYQERYDLNAWNIGAQIVWKNYSIAYSYGDWGRSLLYKNFAILNGDYQVPTQGRKSYYHTLGLGANYGGNKLDAWSVGSDIKIISMKYLRVEPFFEYVGFHFHTPENQLKVGGVKYKALKNTGFVISTGIRVSF